MIPKRNDKSSASPLEILQKLTKKLLKSFLRCSGHILKLFGGRYLFRQGARRRLDGIDGVDWSSLCEKEFLKNLYADMCSDK